MNKKIGVVIITFLFISLVIVSVFGIKKSNELQNKDKQEYAEWLQKNIIDQKKSELGQAQKEVKEAEKEVKETAATEENLDFNQKLQKGKSINILVLGDGLALSQGKDTTDGSWDKNLVNLIKNTYKSDSQLKNLGEQGCTIIRGNEILASNDIHSFDLILTCFGQSDRNKGVTLQDFKQGYTDLIKNIKSKNSKAVIIPILPNTLNLESDYRNQILSVVKENTLIAADVKTAFLNTGNQSELTVGVLPNDNGYKIYTQVISEVIKQYTKTN
ncbi:SGNH/GDSL hydrolase family protein [Inconstantimicrobium mannanitabidum]|uniref:Uncharacterized protein n=1 Tax=Inconstantimicrobium mannanitabidum TaxID=1604901 RepID=A0ACB5REX3_9CLOT|nr:SGNH/GDSL hydrolase family protein [Clostridium sp. TW13]GKX67449.1 hypothetical protein rsdtw13_27070 [Clostridium sp. TW13]